MSLTTSEKVQLQQNKNWLDFIWMSIVMHATSELLGITDPSNVTAEQKLAQKYRTQALNSRASVFVSAATWIASLIDTEQFFGADITYQQIEDGIGNGTYDSAIATIITGSWPLIAAISEQEEISA